MRGSSPPALWPQPAFPGYRQGMSAGVGAAWGLAGGLCVEALALCALIRSTPGWNWRRPIPQGLAAYLISVVLRAGAGAGLAAVAAGSGQVSGAFAAFTLGVAAPLIVERLSRLVRSAPRGTGDPLRAVRPVPERRCPTTA
jgi:hypothetical protein